MSFKFMDVHEVVKINEEMDRLYKEKEEALKKALTTNLSEDIADYNNKLEKYMKYFKENLHKVMATPI